MNQNLRMIIGGSASTGSSLLAHILNNHSKIFCGIETNLFTQSAWISNWQKEKKNIQSTSQKDIMSEGWHVHKGLQISELLDNQELTHIAANSTNYQEFIYRIYSYVNSTKDEIIIAEKTPSNSANFHLLRSHFDNLQYILTLRNPLDTISSMRRRGWSLIYSCGLYLFNLAIGFDHTADLNVVRYEDLCRDTSDVISSLLQRVDLELEESMIQNLESMEMLPSWEADKNIKDDRLIDISKSERGKIEFLVDHLCFKPEYEYYGKKPAFQNIREIMEHFNYFMFETTEVNFGRLHATFALKVEKVKRRFKNYPLAGGDFPFVIN